jgi:hypothetical protein
MLQVLMDVFDLEKLRPVFVPKRVMLDQFTIGKYGQLLVEKNCFLGTYSTEVIYFGIKKARQRITDGFRDKLKRKEGIC